MTKLSLRLRLIILFVIISGIFGAMAGVLSWHCLLYTSPSPRD